MMQTKQQAIDSGKLALSQILNDLSQPLCVDPIRCRLREDQAHKIEALMHEYNCFNLSAVVRFLIDAALLQFPDVSGVK
jgi:hypothetical protein